MFKTGISLDLDKTLDFAMYSNRHPVSNVVHSCSYLFTPPLLVMAGHGGARGRPMSRLFFLTFVQISD